MSDDTMPRNRKRPAPAAPAPVPLPEEAAPEEIPVPTADTSDAEPVGPPVSHGWLPVVAPSVSFRTEGDRRIYAAGAVDLFVVSLCRPDTYTLLRDFPAYGWRAGDHQHLAEPCEASALATARDLARCVVDDAG